ncbi:MAG: ABC transporter ATP-binding protein [Rhodospirillales bacterium]|nr:ABC transporter ATP-binding protein [Rhodospirillales bacterium]
MSVNEAICAEGLGKRYAVGSAAQHNTLRDVIAEGARGLFRRSAARSNSRDFWALRDASFVIRHGESVGIIGLNGAGKSTLLKLLSRITVPTTGRAVIAGRVSALLEVGTGFHWELTGRENIYLYSAILGMPREEVRRNFEAIVEFAGLADFIDTPVKRYSSGMYVRLAFSVAAHLRPDILLLDEVLSVGDVSFQKKCMDFSRNLQRSQATILFVSHNMFSIKTMCSRVIYLKGGRIVFDGPTDKGIELYETDCRLATLRTGAAPEQWPVMIKDVVISGEAGDDKTVFDLGERMRIRIVYESRTKLVDPNFIIAFLRSDAVACCNFSSEADGVKVDGEQGVATIEVLTPPLKLVADVYTVHILIRERGFQEVLCAQIGGTFHVRHDLFDAHFGVFHEAGTWSCGSPYAVGGETCSGPGASSLGALRRTEEASPAAVAVLERK